MFLFLLITVILIGGVVFLLVQDNTKEIAENWPKYRCSPTVMPFAALYGHDTAENFNFCLGNIFQLNASILMNPLTGILGVIIQAVQTFISSINSLRLQLATLVGGVTKIAQEFSDRITQIMLRVKVTAMRMKMLIGRLFATFYAVIYMGMSGITAVLNFGDTFLFKFLDTFCFPPETLVKIEGYELPIEISQVKVGDKFKDGRRITATFQFFSDGQPMVQLPNGLQVSTNHYIQSNGKWIQARDYPNATLIEPWTGGVARPLICLNTEDHILPIGGYTLLDYDETETGDMATMKWVEQSVNAGVFSRKDPLEYSPSVSPETCLRMVTNSIRQAKDIRLGDVLSTGNVVGIIQKEVMNVCEIQNGVVLGEGTMIWDPEKCLWVRAGHLYKSREVPSIFYSFVVSPTAQIELASGHRIRDYVEVHSPETEQFYAEKVAKSVAPLNSEEVTVR